MADVAYFLGVLLIKLVVVSVALVVSAVALIIGVPFAILWPWPNGTTWRHAVRTRMRRITIFVLHTLEVAWTALDTPA